jgi:uncharacterized damage-inducible protein DinB
MEHSLVSRNYIKEQAIMNRDTLRTLYAYKARANRVLLDTAAQLDEHLFKHESDTSHGSVQRMLLHMLDTEAYFLSCCFDERLQLNSSSKSTFDIIRSEWNRIEQLAKKFIASLSDDELQEEVTLPLNGTTLQFPMWQMFMQVYTHSTHHRGELSGMLTALGYPLPTLDIIMYFAEQSGQSWPD